MEATMKRSCVLAVTALFLGLVMTGPAVALGPLDGEVGAVYWANDFDVNNISSDSGAPGFRGEIWMMKKYGVRAGMYSSEYDDFGGGSSDYASVDLLWKPISPTENNFLAFGLGWQQTDLSDIGFDGDTSGIRVAAEGRVGLGGLFHGYLQAAYIPELDTTAAADGISGPFEDVESMEYELGVSWKAAPFVSVRAGYRETSVDFVQDGGGGTAESSGFLLGLGFHF